MYPKQNEYDFVIVGGGTAGLVVATRLTENSGASVLVLEAGVNALQDPRVAVPALWSAILGTDLDWNFLTTAQEHLNHRQIGQPQGRLLGGSSGLNAEVFVPPLAAGFDAWESAGNQGWGWKDLLPYFRKSHNLVAPDPKLQEHLDINWVGKTFATEDGPIQATFTDSTENPLGKAWVETFRTLDSGLTADPFSGRSTGAFSCPSSVDPDTKTRSYSASAYYAPAAGRPNFEVVTGATVNRITFDGSGSIAARSVVFKTEDDTDHEVKARCEIVLAAGAFQTPKLLELSGIGASSLLGKHGIPCRVDNPGVGENLQDHLMTGVSFEVAEGVMTGDTLLRQDPGIFDLFMRMYQEHKSGPLASGSLTSYAFVPIMSTAIDKLDPGAQMKLDEAMNTLSSSSSTSDYERANTKVLTKLIRDQTEATGVLFAISAQVNLHNGPHQIGMTSNPVDGNYLSIGSMHAHPLSRGSSHIASSSPNDPPIIDPRYLSNPLDIEVFARHLMFIEVLTQTEPLASLLKPGGRRAQPGPNGAHLDTVEKAKEYIRSTALSNNHPVGTCAMLPRERGGVVDAELKVYGVDRIRIVDSSVMPFIQTSNIQTTVYTVAEKAADLIKKSYGL